MFDNKSDSVHLVNSNGPGQCLIINNHLTFYQTRPKKKHKTLLLKILTDS